MSEQRQNISRSFLIVSSIAFLLGVFFCHTAKAYYSYFNPKDTKPEVLIVKAPRDGVVYEEVRIPQAKKVKLSFEGKKSQEILKKAIEILRLPSSQEVHILRENEKELPAYWPFEVDIMRTKICVEKLPFDFAILGFSGVYKWTNFNKTIRARFTGIMNEQAVFPMKPLFIPINEAGESDRMKKSSDSLTAYFAFPRELVFESHRHSGFAQFRLINILEYFEPGSTVQFSLRMLHIKVDEQVFDIPFNVDFPVVSRR